MYICVLVDWLLCSGQDHKGEFPFRDNQSFWQLSEETGEDQGWCLFIVTLQFKARIATMFWLMTESEWEMNDGSLLL